MSTGYSTMNSSRLGSDQAGIYVAGFHIKNKAFVWPLLLSWYINWE